MAYPGICACRGQKNLRFSGVIATDGAGSPRSGSSEKLSTPDLVKIRREEQKQAAGLGGYAAILQLGHPSPEVRGPGRNALTSDLLQIFKTAKPKVLYLHNPADRHETHVAVLLASLAALRQALHYYSTALFSFAVQLLVLNLLVYLIVTERPIETAVLNGVAVATGALLNYLAASLWVFSPSRHPLRKLHW